MKNSYGKFNQLLFIKTLFAFIMMLSVNNEAKASHAAGADLTYRWLSGNTYEVTAAFYRDCGGIARPNTVTLNYGSVSCNYNNSITLPIVNNGPVITYPCNSTLTTCNGGSAPGIQQWLYRGNITLPFACTDWLMSYEVVARNCAITTIVQPSPCNSSTSYEPIYVEALLNNVTAPTNSSPSFSNVPISFICLGQDFNYNHGVLDIDADSLAYSLITPLTSTNTTVSYLAGYSAASPIASTPAFSINTVTGDLFMHSTMLQVSVVAVKIREYRNGVLIGSVIRDMQIYSRNCSPNVVPAASGINGTNDFTAYVCPGTNICFDINSSDANPGDVVTMSWNSGVPGATFNISGSPFPTGNFCWTPQLSDARDQPYTFTVTVRDDACPLNGLQTYSYSVYVPKVDADVISSDFSGFGVSCNGDANGTLTADPTGGILPFTYEWNNNETTQAITGLSAGTYTVTVTDSKGCSKTIAGSVIEPDPIVASVNSSENPTCGLNNGTATASAVGGAGGNEYLWSDNQTTQTATGLGAGTYTVTVTDDNGCSSVSQVTLQNVGDPYFNQVAAAICLGASYQLPDGSVVNTADTYQSNLQTVNGCDSIIVTVLTVNDVITTNVDAAICDGDIYLLPDGTPVTLADTYNTTLQSSAGCDSLVITSLVVNPNYSSSEDIAICSGSSYMLPNGQSVSEEGQYVSELVSVSGCDSVITTNLTVNPVITTNVDAAICDGATYILPDGTPVTLADTYNTMLESVAGCDSLIITNLVVNPVYSSIENIEICTGGSYLLPNGQTVSAGGQYISSLESVAGCDSIITTNLIVNDVYTSTESVEICPGVIHTLPNGQTVAEPGEYVSTLTSVAGCDSVITTTVSFIIVESPTVTASGPLSFCPGGSVTLTSSPATSYQWLKNGNPIAGAVLQSYTATTSGNYKVRVSTACGDRTSGSNIVIKHSLPIVTLSPAGLVKICSYDNLLITANVAGTDPVTYQWYRNNVAIQGATNSTYVASQNGNYRVLVTNSITGCQKLSAKTTVSKVNFTAVLTHDNPLVTCDVDITFTLTTNAGPGATYVWKRNNVVLPNVNGLTYTTKIAGTYKVLVTDENGCTKHSNAFTVIVDCKKDKDKREINPTPSYNVFPNPSSTGMVYITKSNGDMSGATAELYDISGRVVLTLNQDAENQMKFDANSLSRGIYFIRISEEGHVITRKIVVE